ncbi:MAG: ABC transporter ATP-binding protein [Bacteroidota bacterium]
MIGGRSLRDDLHRWWECQRGRSDPFNKVGIDATALGSDTKVWALQGVDLEVKQGEVLGIIGKNGAGKSTLLKILSRITAPTVGVVRIRGRVASLLEVGTGFHPELSGRENIYLNGAIMGMTQREVRSKFDEIVAFSEIERFVDTPVKRYSSGMYVRLGFAVAAHLDPEILIVDEVLAVGDIEFQKKCIGKMEDVTNEGRTVIFVSHNMSSIQRICKRGVLIDKGRVASQGEIVDVVREYLSSSTSTKYINNLNSESIKIVSAEIHMDDVRFQSAIIVAVRIKSPLTVDVALEYRFYSQTGEPVGYCSLGALNAAELIGLTDGETHIAVKIDISNLAIGGYYLSIDVTKPDIRYYHRAEKCLNFEIARPPLGSDYRMLRQEWGYGNVQFGVVLLKEHENIT